MKKLLLLVCSFITLCSHAQSYSYLPMPDSTGVWNGYLQGYENGFNFIQLPYSVYQNRDTIIKGINYHAIYQQQGGFIYGMREDSSRKVYIVHSLSYYNTVDTFEHLLYDFNMQVGQSFYDSIYQWRPTVMSIDTIATPGGLRRQFTISNKAIADSNALDYWIEGVGSLRILANALIDPFESGYCLSYLTVQGQLTYQDTLACYYIPNGITEVPLSNIKLYPSPADRVLTIDMSQNNNAISSNYTAINLYDAIGQRVGSIPRKGSNKIVEVSISPRSLMRRARK